MKTINCFSLILVFMLIFLLIPTKSLASDYTNHWAAPYIDQASKLGWFNEKEAFRLLEAR